MERIKDENGYYYEEDFWHAKDFLIEAHPSQTKKNGIIYTSVAYDFSNAPHKGKTRCKKMKGKTPQIAIKFMKDEIKSKYKIPAEMQEWLDSDRKYFQRIAYERKKKEKK
jgi:hypothetical protein